MKDILFITHFTKAPNEKGNGRFHYIAENINKENARVEVVTSSYAHKGKQQRKLTKEHLDSITYKFTTLYEPGYIKNASIKRLYSHHVFGKNLKKYLKTRKKPDVIYCAVPSLDAAKVAAKYATENNIKFIIDVQDLWPEAFKMLVNIPVISNILFYPSLKSANYVYSVADEIFAVSKTYADRALRENRKCKVAHTIPLGTDLSYFDKLAIENQNVEKPEDEIWLGYVGTLSHAYDIKCVIDSLKIIKNQGINNIKFIIMGDGPLRKEFEDYATLNDVNVHFTGRLDYGKMVGLLTMCDIAVNPISSGAVASIINKHADYAAAGLPVLNTQESIEYRNLVNEYEMGINCENNNPVDLAENLLKLYSNRSLRVSMGKNSRKLAKDKFDRAKIYKKIFSILEE